MAIINIYCFKIPIHMILVTILIYDIRSYSLTPICDVRGFTFIFNLWSKTQVVCLSRFVAVAETTYVITVMCSNNNKLTRNSLTMNKTNKTKISFCGHGCHQKVPTLWVHVLAHYLIFSTSSCHIHPFFVCRRSLRVCLSIYLFVSPSFLSLIHI